MILKSLINKIIRKFRKPKNKKSFFNGPMHVNCRCSIQYLRGNYDKTRNTQ